MNFLALVDKLEESRKKFLGMFPAAKIRMGQVSCSTGEGMSPLREKLEDVSHRL